MNEAKISPEQAKKERVKLPRPTIFYAEKETIKVVEKPKKKAYWKSFIVNNRYFLATISISVVGSLVSLVSLGEVSGVIPTIAVLLMAAERIRK